VRDMRHRARVFSPTDDKTFSNEHVPDKGGVVPEIPSRGDGVRQFVVVFIVVVVDDAALRRGREEI